MAASKSKSPATATATATASTIITVLPGDNVTPYIEKSMNSNNNNKKYKLGTGLLQKSDHHIIATSAGRLHQNHSTWFILQNIKRYSPKQEDRVVGVVQDRQGTMNGADVYRVDIGAPHCAMLSSLAFEGATKRNRPQFSPGTLVYGRVSECHVTNVVDAQLSCQLGPRDEGIARKDWMTEEAAYGELKGGTVQKIPLGLARELLSPTNVVLDELSRLPFEVAIGVNGMLWIHAKKPEYIILVRNAVLNSQVLTEDQTRGMVRSLIKTVNAQICDDDDDDDDDDNDDDDAEQ